MTDTMTINDHPQYERPLEVVAPCGCSEAWIEFPHMNIEVRGNVDWRKRWNALRVLITPCKTYIETFPDCTVRLKPQNTKHSDPSAGENS